MFINLVFHNGCIHKHDKAGTTLNAPVNTRYQRKPLKVKILCAAAGNGLYPAPAGPASGELKSVFQTTRGSPFRYSTLARLKKGRKPLCIGLLGNRLQRTFFKTEETMPQLNNSKKTKCNFYVWI
ncbi:hypothetical protein COCON_G00152270 [Conger conger]|uniref:Uncharacterized protein n=1 Tax=Conger conger TaxID=82655 RepID=A0A9Q1D8Q7_CONCO|nr:hypothetical protein COCON_G00152270 [Conger conger]